MAIFVGATIGPAAFWTMRGLPVHPQIRWIVRSRSGENGVIQHKQALKPLPVTVFVERDLQTFQQSEAQMLLYQNMVDSNTSFQITRTWATTPIPQVLTYKWYVRNFRTVGDLQYFPVQSGAAIHDPIGRFWMALEFDLLCDVFSAPIP